MKREPVESSNIRSVGYDASRKVLEVEFVNGTIFDYSDFPEELHKAFMASPSKGSFFARKVRWVFEGVRQPLLEQPGAPPERKPDETQ